VPSPPSGVDTNAPCYQRLYSELGSLAYIIFDVIIESFKSGDGKGVNGEINVSPSECLLAFVH